MSMFDNDQAQADDDRPVTLSRHDIRQLEAAARRGKKAEELERENAMLKAGIDVTTPTGAMFLRAYDGELTPEAIATAAAGIPGLTETKDATPEPTPTQDPEPTPAPTPDPSVAAEAAERAALAQGAAPPGSGVPVKAAAMEEAQAGLRHGARVEEAIGHYVNRVAQAAANGDQSVVVNPRR